MYLLFKALEMLAIVSCSYFVQSSYLGYIHIILTYLTVLIYCCESSKDFYPYKVGQSKINEE